MVPYNPKHWDRILFSFHGTVLPRTLKRVAIYGGLTAAVWASGPDSRDVIHTAAKAAQADSIA